MASYTELAAEWMKAHAKEAEWAERRRAIEEEMKAQFFPTLPEEGQRSYKEGNYQTVAKNALYLKVTDKEGFDLAIREGVLDTSFVKPSFNETALRQLRRAALAQDNPSLELYHRVLPLFDITPAKTSFKVVKTA